MPGHEDRMKTCSDLTETLMSSLQPRVMHDILLERGAHNDLRESLYVYEKLNRCDCSDSVDDRGEVIFVSLTCCL